MQNLPHNLDQVREFYQSLPPAIIGIEATSKAIWFENLVAETNHQLVVGNPTLIRKKATSRHKSDKRDAELILNLLLKDESTDFHPDTVSYLQAFSPVSSLFLALLCHISYSMSLYYSNLAFFEEALPNINIPQRRREQDQNPILCG